MAELAAGVPILYEDNHVLVVVKPANMPTQEDESRDPDLLSVLKAGVKVRYGKPGNVFLGLVHRLDRPVGGVMVFARTSKAASRLSDAVRTRAFRKTYVAAVRGTPASPAGTLRHYLVKDAKTNTVRTVPQSYPGAKEAVLDYTVLGSAEGFALTEVHLHTGRPHQIRVQFAAIGCPLYGDQRYGGHFSEPGQQIALWSAMLGFEHPTTKEPLRFHALPPEAYPWTLWRASIRDFVQQIH
ncbi:pseudouridine synthase [Gordoniibacillus kamchatkensis]|uniref:RNA pseudouridylate synthase n=1 Tax=Gordoniibacillus kamchatkensis TaxID=1590651 RepID=A0ABR5AGH3_9BACL|nr:pseudouridine synthase [Paenibacillus sp. VKM B-2647]